MGYLRKISLYKHSKFSKKAKTIRLPSRTMKFLEAIVALVAVTAMLPFLTCASSMETSSSLHYCNTTGDRVVTTGEVCQAIFEGLDEIDEFCNQDGMVCLPLQNTIIYIRTTHVTFFSNAKCFL